MRVSSVIIATCTISGLGLASAEPGLGVARERFVHESVPGYALDVVDPSSLGLAPGVKQQAGYLSTPSGDQLFYWYFESQSSPSTDPVLIWLNGGPGCSSLEAVLFENGPSSMSDAGTISVNPWSWNKHANMLYIDNPAGVGYSTGGGVYDSNAAATDFKSAVRLFWERNKAQLANSKLHLSGESYAGRYVPVFAEAINTDPEGAIKISSIMLGNGLVDPAAEYNSYEPMLCGAGGYASVLSGEQCSRMSTQASACSQVLEACMSGGGLSCTLASAACGRLQSFFRGRNPYDIRDAACTQTQTGLCYTGLDHVQAYFEQASVKQALGVNANQGYSICNTGISSEFYAANDPLQPTFRNITALLNAGVPVLVYHGDADIVLNWLGGREWTTSLQWAGQPGFQAAAARPQQWVPAGAQPRGEVTNSEHFTFLRASGAGHMVPHDQPESAYYLVYQWLHGDYALQQKVPG